MRRRLLTIFAIALLIATPLSGCMDLLDRFQDRTAGPGDLAEDYIRDDTYTKLIIEIDHAPNAAPNDEAVQVLRSTAQEVLAKASVTVERSAELPTRGQDHKYTWEELAELEEEHRDRYGEGDTIVLYMQYVDGGSEADQGDGRVLGAAYRGSSVVMFKGNIRQASCTDCGLINSKPQERFVERAVIVHELGHILGLVNNGIPMVEPHEDADHPHHSDNQDSVMYWAVETGAINNIFSQGSDIPYRFDANDKQDIRNVREGGA